MMPHVYGRLIPDNLKLVFTNNFIQPTINHTLSNYLELATKASEQYSEIWEYMSKITNMYENLGDKPKIYYETREILNVFKLSLENTMSSISETKQNIQALIEVISNCKKGDNAIIKTGNLFSQVDIDCIYILSLCFNDVYIYKPAASSAILSEKYVVCKNFKMHTIDYLKSTFGQILCELKVAQNIKCISLYSRRISRNYINTLVEANSVIGQHQLEAINNTITLIEQGKKKEKIEALKKQQAIKCADWNKKFGMTLTQYKHEIEA
jgi:hypothetical protein